jgi:TonB family protein
MTGSAMLLALLLQAAAPAPAAPPVPADAAAAARDAANGAVLLSQYPPRARAAGERGVVGFKVSLDRDGYATACEVTRSSGYPRLDEETCQLILNHATFRGIDEGGRRKVNAVYDGSVNWRLPAGGAAAAPTQVASAAPPEKMICRRRVKTGSLAGYERACATKSDWERMAVRNREEWGELQGVKGSTHGN